MHRPLSLTPIFAATALRTIGVSSLQNSTHFLFKEEEIRQKVPSFNAKAIPSSFFYLCLLSDFLLVLPCSLVDRYHHVNSRHSTHELSVHKS